MNAKKLHLGLIGKDVSKSDSEKIHTFILSQMGVECVYERFSVSLDNFDNAMRRLLGDFDGFNVTIPYKRDVMEYLDEIKGDALAFGAINTVITATATGYNTDGIGFMLMLSGAEIVVKNKRVLILGGGGSGRSCAVALKKSGAQVFMYQRNREKLQETCDQLSITPAESAEEGGYDILINCTGVGMHDSEGLSPVTAKAFVGAESAVDLIYTPKQSKFLQIAKEQGLKICNGEGMLFYQAYYADCLYLGIKADEKQAQSLYEEYKNRTEDGRL